MRLVKLMCRLLLMLTLSLPALLASAQTETEGHLIKSIYFGGGSYYVDHFQMEELYHFIDSIPSALSYEVTIHSHTDNIGSAEYNNWLSQMRSTVVTRLLMGKGFPPESMEIKDFGMFNPVYDNRTQEGRERNRRVDVIFWPVLL